MNTWYSGKCEEIETGDDWVKAESGKSDVKPAAETEKRVDTAQDGMRQVHATCAGANARRG